MYVWVSRQTGLASRPRPMPRMSCEETPPEDQAEVQTAAATPQRQMSSRARNLFAAFFILPATGDGIATKIRS